MDEDNFEGVPRFSQTLVLGREGGGGVPTSG